MFDKLVKRFVGKVKTATVEEVKETVEDNWPTYLLVGLGAIALLAIFSAGKPARVVINIFNIISQN